MYLNNPINNIVFLFNIAALTESKGDQGVNEFYESTTLTFVHG